MQGSMEECVQHFLGRLDDSHYETVANFIGLRSLKTVRSWREGKQFPTGERALRLRVFLEAMGYELEELRRVPAPALRVTRLIGYGAMEVSYALEKLKYSEPHGLFRILEGGNPTGSRGYKLEMLGRGTDGLLRSAMQRCEKDLQPLRELAGVAAEPPSVFGSRTDEVKTEKSSTSEPAKSPSPNGGPVDSDTKTLMYLVLALEAHLRRMSDTRDAVQRVRRQVSCKGRRALKELFDQLVQE